MKRRSATYLVGLGVLVLVVGVWFVGLWSPRTHQVAKLKTKVTAASAQDTQLSVQLAQLQSEAHQLPAKRAQLKRMQAAVPSKTDEPQFILQLNGAAKKAGVDLVTISPSQPAVGQSPAGSSTSSASSGQAPSTVSLSLDVNGTFFSILDFMHDLYALPRIVVISGVSLVPGGAGSSGGSASVGQPQKLTVTIRATAFTTQPPLSGSNAPGTASASAEPPAPTASTTPSSSAQSTSSTTAKAAA